MDLKKVAKDTAQTLANYLTFQAVKIAIQQLGETDPPVSIWLRQFSANYSFQQDAERYIQDLLKARQPLGFRVMTIREHLAESIPEFLTEMVKSQVHNANLEQRRQLYERLTVVPETSAHGPGSHPELSDLSFPELDVDAS